LLPRRLLRRRWLGRRRRCCGGLLGSAAATSAGLLGGTVSGGIRLLWLTRCSRISVARNRFDRRCPRWRFRNSEQALACYVGAVVDEDFLRLGEQLRVLVLC